MEHYGIRKQESNAPDKVYQVGDGSFTEALEEFRRIARNAWRSTRNFMQVEFKQTNQMSWWCGTTHHYVEIVKM